MNGEWEEFQKRIHKDDILDQAPIVTIQKSGKLSMNRAAYKSIGTPDAVDFGYNLARGAISIRAAKKNTASYKVTRGGYSNSVSGTAFLRYIGYEIGAYQRLPATIEDDRLVVCLPKKGEQTA